MLIISLLNNFCVWSGIANQFYTLASSVLVPFDCSRCMFNLFPESCYSSDPPLLCNGVSCR